MILLEKKTKSFVPGIFLSTKKFWGDLALVREFLFPAFIDRVGKDLFWEMGLFRKVHFLEILESLEI